MVVFGPKTLCLGKIVSGPTLALASINGTRRRKVYLAQERGVGRDSVVCIATRYGLNGPGIKSRCRVEIFRTCEDRRWGPPSLLYNGYRVFPGGKAAGA